MGLFGTNNSNGTATSKSETKGILKKKKNGLELKASSSWTDEEQDNNATAQKSSKKTPAKAKFWRLHDDLAVENTAISSSLAGVAKTKKSQTKTKNAKTFQRLDTASPPGVPSPREANESLETQPANTLSKTFRSSPLKLTVSSAKKNKGSRPLHTLPSVDEHKTADAPNRSKPMKIPSLRIMKLQQVNSGDSGIASFAEYQPPSFEFGDFGAEIPRPPSALPLQGATQHPPAVSTATVDTNNRNDLKFQSFLEEPLQPCFSEDTQEECAGTGNGTVRRELADIHQTGSGSMTHASEISGLYSESGFPTSKGGHNFQQIVFDKSFHEIKKIEVAKSDVGASDFSDFTSTAAKLTKQLSKKALKKKKTSPPPPSSTSTKKATQESPQRANWPKLGEKKRDTPAYNRQGTPSEGHLHTPVSKTNTPASRSSTPTLPLCKTNTPNQLPNAGAAFNQSSASELVSGSKERARSEHESPNRFAFGKLDTGFEAEQPRTLSQTNTTNHKDSTESTSFHLPFAKESNEQSWHTSESKSISSKDRSRKEHENHPSRFPFGKRDTGFDVTNSWQQPSQRTSGSVTQPDQSGTPQPVPFEEKKRMTSAFSEGNSWSASQHNVKVANHFCEEMRSAQSPFDTATRSSFNGDNASWHTATSKHTSTSKHTARKHGVEQQRDAPPVSRSIPFETKPRSVFDGDSSWHVSRSLDEGGFSVISDLSGTHKDVFNQSSTKQSNAQDQTEQAAVNAFHFPITSSSGHRDTNKSLFEPPTKPSGVERSKVRRTNAEAFPFGSAPSSAPIDMFENSQENKDRSDPFDVGVVDDSVWSGGFDPFSVANGRETAKRSKNMASTTSVDEGLIESIKLASAKKSQTDAVIPHTRKQDPSPRAVFISSSDSALDVPRSSRASNSYSYSPGPQRTPPKAIPTNAILGSMLFRHSQVSHPDGNENAAIPDSTGVPNETEDARDDLGTFDAPIAVIAARDDTESIVSSVTEEASSFYQKSFGGSKNWNKQAHDLIGHYGVNRSNIRENVATTGSTQSKGNLSRLEEEHVNVFLSEV